MDLYRRIVDRSRLTRGVLAAVLAFEAVRSLRKGERTRAALAGVGAGILGYTAATESGHTLDSSHPLETFGAEPARERGDLRCASCGEPIRLGERRGPNADDQIVHESCLEA